MTECESTLLFLETFDDWQTEGIVSISEDYNTISFDLRGDELDEISFEKLLKQVYRNNSLLGGRSFVSTNNYGNLFRITSMGVDNINQESFGEIENETEISPYDLTTALSRSEQETEAIIEYVPQQIEPLLHSEEISIKIKIVLSKKEIINHLFRGNERFENSDVKLFFWYDLSELQQLLFDDHLEEYGSQFFPEYSQPTFVYYEGQINDSKHEPVENESNPLIPFVKASRAQDITFSQVAIKKYQNKLSNVSEVTEFRTNFILSPDLFLESEYHQTIFQIPLVYSLLAVFADQVSKSNSTYRFEILRGDEKASIDIELTRSGESFDEEDIQKLVSLYEKIKEYLPNSTFMGLWRRSIARSCDEEDIETLPLNIESALDEFDFLQREIVDSKFDELSTAVRDTRSLMTDVTGRVSNTAAEVSQEIQRLFAALIGAGLADVYIVMIRGDSPRLIVSFTGLLLFGFVGLYLPLVDQRMWRLDDLQREAGKDYETYQNILNKYSKGTLGIHDLHDRKEKYMNQAAEELYSGIIKIWVAHTILSTLVLVVTWYIFAQFPVFSIPGMIGIVLVLTMGSQTITPIIFNNKRFNHKIFLFENTDEWFQKRKSDIMDSSIYNFVPLLIILLMLIVIKFEIL
jgi:hypothetical protein